MRQDRDRLNFLDDGSESDLGSEEDDRFDTEVGKTEDPQETEPKKQSTKGLVRIGNWKHSYYESGLR